jgi:hypothetical protein
VTAKTTRKIFKLQGEFLHKCCLSLQTLEEVMDDFDITPETLACWLGDREFRIRLHSTRRYLRQTRDVQLEMGARHAADVLSRCVTDTAIKETKPLQRLASVDLVRLARDSRARAAATHSSADDETKNAAIYHPGVPADEARDLMRELTRNDATPSQPSSSQR